MTLDERIAAFEKLGKYLSAIDEATHQQLIVKAGNENSWFTPESIDLALKGVYNYLLPQHLKRWVKPYGLNPASEKVVAIVLAGNIPLVGFHDFLSVLISGHIVQIKLSSKDSVLLRFMIDKLIEVEPRFLRKIQIVEQLKNFRAVIATGSNNSARYFHYYFGKYPNIIRKNRTSCAVLNGKESTDEFLLLARDVFQYFGLGCRNVSKLFLPKNFDITKLLDAWQPFEKIIHHHKYNNNYDYQKSILLVNKMPFLDNGFLLLQESERLVSPISVLFYEYYENEGDLALKLTENKDNIQCMVGKTTPGSIPFGSAQSPMLWDYADQVDTLKFLDSLD
jgi:hypothetical protein